MSTLSPLDWSICIGYLAVVLAMGLWFSREQHDNEDYFVAGRKMHWLPIGLSIFAGTFSSNSFVGLPRDSAYADYHLLLGILFIPFVVMPLVAWLFIPLFHRLQVTSAYEYLEHRFNRPTRLVASVLFMAYAIGWMGNMLLAVGKILKVVLDLTPAELTWALIAVGLFATVYTTLGGVKAVIWTDALQAVALGGGMSTVLLFTVAKIDGGWAALWEIGSANNKFDMFRSPLNMQDLFCSEELNVYSACAFGFFVYLGGHAANFTAVQRYVSMPTVSDARKSLVLNSIMVVVVCLIFFLVGSALFVFYFQTGDPIFQQFNEAQTSDLLLPHFVIHEIPKYGLVGLLLAGLFAAAMSSMDSGINSLTATVVCDWRSEENVGVGWSRLMTCVFGVSTIGAAMLIAQIKLPIFHILIAIAGAFLGLLLGLFVLGMFSHRVNSAGALIGLLAGCGALVAANQLGVSGWWYAVFATVPTVMMGWLASLPFPPPQQESLQGLTVIDAAPVQLPS